MLETGTKAPAFELPDQNGVMHRLEDYKGKKVILYFSQGQYSGMYEAGLRLFGALSAVYGEGRGDTGSQQGLCGLP